MHSEVLSSSYARYKEDTSIFTTWPSSAARRCGYKIDAKKIAGSGLETASHEPASKTPRSKGKKRKAAKAVVSQCGHGHSAMKLPTADDDLARTMYNISTVELLRQAEAVAGWTKNSMRLSGNVENVLERAIAARQ